MKTGARSVAQLALLDDPATGQGAWQVRTSDRARRLTVRIVPGGGVEIVVPPGTRPRAVEQFVARYREWIDRKVAQYKPLVSVAGDELPQIVHFRASGDCWSVEQVDAACAMHVAVDGDRLRLVGDRSSRTPARQALQRFTMEYAHAILVPRLEQLSAEHRLPFAIAQIRRQRTRWGSCSRRGTISLNACLLFQSPAVVRYLLLHELAHTRHLNHSRRFWGLVEQLEPRWRELDAELSRGWREVPSWALR
jgi:predicted metal-dependent hydrolase